MSDMDALRSELSREGLGERDETELPDGEGSELGGSLFRRGRSGEEERSFSGRGAKRILEELRQDEAGE